MVVKNRLGHVIPEVVFERQGKLQVSITSEEEMIPDSRYLVRRSNIIFVHCSIVLRVGGMISC